MVNEQVIERLRLKNWYVECKTKQDADLVLQACDEAEITRESGGKATEWCLFEIYPFNIGFFKDGNGITQDYYNIYEEHELENITDLFFNAIKNNDSKLTPQNAEQEHWVQIILARLKGIPLEAYSIQDRKWIDAGDDCSIFMDYEYRIKPEPIATPLPIPRELWNYIDKKWNYAVMDKDGRIFFYKTTPHRESIYWSASSNMSDCPLNINTDGIDWKLSLTERPKDV